MPSPLLKLRDSRGLKAHTWTSVRPAITRLLDRPGARTRKCSRLWVMTSTRPRNGRHWWANAHFTSTSLLWAMNRKWSALWWQSTTICSPVSQWSRLCRHVRTWWTGPAFSRMHGCRAKMLQLQAWWTARATKISSTDMVQTTARLGAASATWEVSSTEQLLLACQDGSWQLPQKTTDKKSQIMQTYYLRTKNEWMHSHFSL